MNIPRGLGYFLPWTAVARLSRATAALLRRSHGQRLREDSAWGIALSFLGVCLLPGSLARYTMPLLAPASWLIALLLTAERFGLPRWLKLRSPAHCARSCDYRSIVALLVCVAMLFYALR